MFLSIYCDCDVNLSNSIVTVVFGNSCNMRACVYCKTRYEKGSGVTFHKFPSDYYLKLWLKNMNAVNWTPKTYDYLCSKHFTDSCFIKHQSRTSLMKYSIPTIFLETNSSVTSAQAEISKDQDIVINFDQYNSSSEPVKVESLNYNFKYSEMIPKRMSPCETVTTNTATADAKNNGATVAPITQSAEDIQVQTNEVSEQKVKSSTVTEPPRVPSVEPYQPPVIPEVRALISRVYHYLREEYEQLKELTGNSSDLTPLADILQRTAAATGVSEHTVIDILEDDATDAEDADDGQNLDIMSSEDISQVKEELDDVSSEEEQDLKLKIEIETDDERDQSAVKHVLCTTSSSVQNQDPLDISSTTSLPSYLLADASLVTVKIEPGASHLTDHQYAQCPSLAHDNNIHTSDTLTKVKSEPEDDEMRESEHSDVTCATRRVTSQGTTRRVTSQGHRCE